MSVTHFENLVKKAMDECASASINIGASDMQEGAFIHKHGTLKGFYQGLARSLELYRQANRQDSEGEEL